MHTHGTFDLLHIGAVRHLEQARQLGGVLVVTLTPDAELLHAGIQPLFKQDLRAEALAALSCVDYVAVAKSGLGPDAIQLICPDIYVPWEENDPGDVDYRKVHETEAAMVRAPGRTIRRLDLHGREDYQAEPPSVAGLYAGSQRVPQLVPYSLFPGRRGRGPRKSPRHLSALPGRGDHRRVPIL